VLEFVEGTTLREHMGSGKMSFDAAYAMLRPAMESLDRMHSAEKTAHLDLSPSNIMLLPNGRVKIIDFGAAAEFGSMNSDSIHVLKPGYAPEEQYRTNGVISAASDVYAMCATLYSLITGNTPDTSTDRLYKDELPLPRKLGAEISQAQQDELMRGMGILQDKRIQSMAELIRAFDNPGKVSRFFTPGKIIIAAAAVTVIAVGALFLSNRGGDPSVGAITADFAISESGTAEVTPSPKPTPAPTLCPDAYPTQIYSQQKELSAYEPVTVFDKNGLTVALTRCFYGDNRLTFIAEYNNTNDFIIDGSFTFRPRFGSYFFSDSFHCAAGKSGYTSFVIDMSSYAQKEDT